MRLPIEYYYKQEEDELDYQLILPEKYAEEPEKQWPLIVYLHGSNRRGSDIHVFDNYGFAQAMQSLDDFGFIVVTPQCPNHSSWIIEQEQIMAIYRHILASYRVDRNRVYLTGYSMGGNGAWNLATRYPELFASVVPISGWYRTDKVELLKDIPIWNFHGEEDDIIPIQKSEEIVMALMNVGGQVKFTRYPGMGHKVMEITYSNPELYAWLLAHRLGDG